MATLCEHPTFAMTSLPKSRGQAVLTLRELASSLKLRGGGARLGDVVALLVIDRLGRRPVLVGGLLVPEPGPRCVPRSRCPGVRRLRDLQRRTVDT
jgi:hypothetical protein